MPGGGSQLGRHHNKRYDEPWKQASLSSWRPTTHRERQIRRPQRTGGRDGGDSERPSEVPRDPAQGGLRDLLPGLPRESYRLSRSFRSSRLFLLDVYKEYDDFSYLRAFHHAIEAHSIKCLKWLVAEGTNVNKTDDKGISPLMFHGTESVDSHILKALIEVGADVNQKDEQGRTPLMFRAMDPHARCMETLIEAGADVNATCKKRQTAMMYMIQMPFSLQFILFHTADCVVVLLRAGYKVNAVKKERLRLNALTMLLCPPDVKNESVELLLFAAGERVKLRAVRAKGREIPEYLQPQFNLKDICRRKIREHLLRLDPHTHLFGQGTEAGNSDMTAPLPAV